MDERLTLAASLYEPCDVGADIGTDHGLLPCYLMNHGICNRMILADISEKALQHARDQVRRQGLEDRARLICTDGLNAVDEKVGCISITGMGGQTMADIVLNGRERLQGAALVLSAHTDQELVRRAVQEIGYHLVAEKLCRVAGRFYLVWKALPGEEKLDEDAIALGTPMLLESENPLLEEYLARRTWVLERQLAGLQRVADAHQAEVEELHHRLDVLRRYRQC